MEIKTSEYEFTHGKKPRGKGNWAFFFSNNTDDVTKAFFFNGSYSEALKNAKQKAKEQNVSVIKVGA